MAWRPTYRGRCASSHTWHNASSAASSPSHTPLLLSASRLSHDPGSAWRTFPDRGSRQVIEHLLVALLLRQAQVAQADSQGVRLGLSPAVGGPAKPVLERGFDRRFGRALVA